MSYRNDHDAALARIDALEAELNQSADARAKFASLAEQLAQAKRERDRAIAESKQTMGWKLPTLLSVLAVALVGGIGVASTRHHREEAPPAPAAFVAPSPNLERTKLLACVDQLDAHIGQHDASSDACLATLTTEIGDVGLGTDIHQTLVDWSHAEQVHAWNDRLALADRIHSYIIPSFTR